MASPVWKIQKMVKDLASVFKRLVYDVRSSKKIWAQLEVPLRMFIGVLLSNLPIGCHLQGNLRT